MSIDIEMTCMPESYRYKWCRSKNCACLGCANKAGGLAAKGYTWEDWNKWVGKNMQEYVNAVFSTKDEKMEYTRNWQVEMQNANYPMLEIIDENTVMIEGVKYQKVDEVESPSKPPIQTPE